MSHHNLIHILPADAVLLSQHSLNGETELLIDVDGLQVAGKDPQRDFAQLLVPGPVKQAGDHSAADPPVTVFGDDCYPQVGHVDTRAWRSKQASMAHHVAVYLCHDDQVVVQFTASGQDPAPAFGHDEVRWHQVEAFVTNSVDVALSGTQVGSSSIADTERTWPMANDGRQCTRVNDSSFASAWHDHIG